MINRLENNQTEPVPAQSPGGKNPHPNPRAPGRALHGAFSFRWESMVKIGSVADAGFQIGARDHQRHGFQRGWFEAKAQIKGLGLI